jgi:hypothetical protein
MAIEETLSIIPESLIGSVKALIYIAQAVGIFVIGYIIYLAVKTFLDRKRLKAIEKISKDVDEIKNMLRGKKKK